MPTFEFTAPVWRTPGPAGWHFLTLPQDVSDEIADLAAGSARGFGAVRVEVQVGGTRWQTSVFPDTKAGAYILPVKQAVRRAEDITAGDDVSVSLRL